MFVVNSGQDDPHTIHYDSSYPIKDMLIAAVKKKMHRTSQVNCDATVEHIALEQLRD